MSKSIKKCFDEKLTFQKLLEAHERAKVGKSSKREIMEFEINLETNIYKMYEELKNNKYQFGIYRDFYVYEPKERLIRSLPYRDRIIHQWYVEEFIKPFFSKRFIKDTYACLDGRGTHKAVIQVQKYMRKMQKKYGSYYVLKCDIKKYFYNIDKSILLNILKKGIKDNKIIKFTEQILNDGNHIGIPIGNYTSQYFANIYLNEVDHYIKEILRCKYYIRYMDDLVLLVENKSVAKYFLDRIQQFLANNLHLELNQKSTYYPNKKGIDFCGYRIYENHIKLRKRFKRKIQKQFKIWNSLKDKNILDKQKVNASYNSFKAHAKHCNSYNYISKINSKFEKLMD